MANLFRYFKIIMRQVYNREQINDRFLLRAGVAAFESANYRSALNLFKRITRRYSPTSKYYRSAKLWIGLSSLKMGDRDKFIQSVQEFERKYQNTTEWVYLRPYYENIIKK